MKNLFYLLLALQPCIASAQSGTVDLTELANYADQPIPNYISRDNTPGTNPINDLEATLGRVLFYDKRLSRNSSISCASCHQQAHGFSDLNLASTGVAGTTGRHSMRLVNSRFAQSGRFFWDERAPTLELQTTQPIQDHVEMGFSGTLDDPNFADLVTRLTAIDDYRVLFTAVHGEPIITETRVQRALAQFIRSIQSFDSKFDQGRVDAPNDGAPFANFSLAENRGKDIFLRRARCASCHRPPEFDIDPNSGNNGIVSSLAGGTDNANTRSPSLRDVVKPSGNTNGPFMHDGSKANLAAVVAHYNAIPAIAPGMDPRLIQRGPPGAPPQPQRLNLSTQEQADLVTFLATLSGSNLYEDAKWSSPFSNEDELTLILLPTDSLQMDMDSGEDSHSIVISATGVAGLDYFFQKSTDGINWAEVAVTADASGHLSVEVNPSASERKWFYRFVYRVPVTP